VWFSAHRGTGVDRMEGNAHIDASGYFDGKKQVQHFMVKGMQRKAGQKMKGECPKGPEHVLSRQGEMGKSDSGEPSSRPSEGLDRSTYQKDLVE